MAKVENRAFLESWGDIVDRSEPFFDDIAQSYQRQQHATRRRDRQDGRFLPVYDNEVDLQIIRAMARLLHERVPMAKAKTNRLVDYTVSRGFDWSVTHDSPDVQARAEGVLTRFVKNNRWTVEGERDSFAQECIDGEFLAELVLDQGDIVMNYLGSDNLVEPSNPRAIEEWLGTDDDFVSSWLFGVHSKQYAVHRPKGYHIVRDEGGVDWDYVPSVRFLHWKRNVPLMAARGFSDHYTTHVYLGRADKVVANTAEGAAVQAAIAYIVEHVEGTNATQAQNVINSLLNVNVRDPVNGIQRRGKKIVPGQRLDIPSGMKYHAGLFGSNNSKIYIDVMESLIRLSGTIDAFPEHMLTGFAGNNNMASSLTAESPFIQGRLADQEVRKMRLMDMFEKVLRLAVQAGMFPGWSWLDLRESLEISISQPSIVFRDPVALTQSLSAQKAEGWVSDRTASNELGRDYDQEQANIEKQKPPPGQEPGGPPGGAPGGPPAGPADESVGVGGMAALSRMQFKRNRAAILDILKDFESGVASQTQAMALLRSLGLTTEEAKGIMDIDSDVPEDVVPVGESQGARRPVRLNRYY